MPSFHITFFLYFSNSSGEGGGVKVCCIWLAIKKLENKDESILGVTVMYAGKLLDSVDLETLTECKVDAGKYSLTD